MAAIINRRGDFGAIVEPLFSNACTPDLDDDEGILVNLPEEVPITSEGETPVVRLAGMCQLPYDTLGLRGSFADHIVFVAVDALTHEARANQFTVVENPAPTPPSEASEGRPELVIAAYFNPDLGALLRLPPAPAEYIVYATLGAHQSNVLRVRITRPQGIAEEP